MQVEDEKFIYLDQVPDRDERVHITGFPPFRQDLKVNLGSLQSWIRMTGMPEDGKFTIRFKSRESGRKSPQASISSVSPSGVASLIGSTVSTSEKPRGTVSREEHNVVITLEYTAELTQTAEETAALLSQLFVHAMGGLGYERYKPYMLTFLQFMEFLRLISIMSSFGIVTESVKQSHGPLLVMLAQFLLEFAKSRGEASIYLAVAFIIYRSISKIRDVGDFDPKKIHEYYRNLWQIIYPVETTQMIVTTINAKTRAIFQGNVFTTTKK